MEAATFTDIITDYRKSAVNTTGDEYTLAPVKGQGVLISRSYARHYDSVYPAALSLVYVVKGAAYIVTGNSRYKLVAGNYLVLNQGSAYKSYTNPGGFIESYAIHFSADFIRQCQEVRSAYRASQPATALCTETIFSRFVERTYQQNEKLSMVLARLGGLVQEAYNSGQPIRATDISRLLKSIISLLIVVDAGVQVEINSMEAIRRSTREEVYRRLNYARSFMDSSYDQQISVEDVAATACMNADYFTRLFRKQFGITPVQYLIAKRMNEASRLLQQKKKSVSEVCRAVGYADISSFGRLFKRYHGLTPELYNKVMWQPYITGRAGAASRLLQNAPSLQEPHLISKTKILQYVE